MSTYNLDAFLRPASVALVGASHDPGSIGGVTARNLGAFAGRVFRVDRRLPADPVRGIYASIRSLPECPELAIVAVAAARVPAVIVELGGLGTRAAIVLSTGFSETGAGGGSIAEMLAAARTTGMRILGPDCMGVLAPRAGLNAGFAQALPLAGNLACLSQSGGVLTTLVDWASARDVGFSAMVSLGAMAEADAADWLDYFATDPQTSAILMYLESIRGARKFMSAARHASRLKPVIALKARRGPTPAAGAALGAATFARGDGVIDAAFRRAGIQRVGTVMRMLEAAETLAFAQPPQGEALALLANGGGVAALAADQLLAGGGALAELSGATRTALDAVLPPAWSHRNPVDVVDDAGPDRYRAALQILLAAPEVDAVATMYCPTGLGDPAAVAEAVAATVQRSADHKCVLAAWLGPVTGAAARGPFARARIPSFDTPEGIVRALQQLTERRRQQAHLSEAVPAFPLRESDGRGQVRALIDGWLAGGAGAGWLDEVDAKRLLTAAGIDANESRRAEDPEATRSAASAMQGPYAVKILSPDLLRRSDVGGVALNVETPDEVGRVTARMIERLHVRYPTARLSGVAVQRMVDRTDAHELIAGIAEDPVFGPVIVFGAGGVAADAIDDIALALPPLNVNLARDLIEQTRIHRLLAGAGGHVPAVDMDALVAVLVRLSELACGFPGIVDLDINPLLAGPDGAIALDARMRLQAVQGLPTDRLAIMPYPRDLERSFVLPDGTRRRLRPIRPEDEAPLRAAFLKLSPESRYMRMFAAASDLPHDVAARATQIDYDREMAFVISDDKPAGEAALYGGVRLVSDANRERGEFAITVLDALAGHGVGRRLMHVIIDYARAIGIREIVGDVLAENTPMLALCRELGFQLAAPADGTVEVRLVLHPPGGRGHGVATP